ncbi:MAG: sigma-70 domain-containing protein [Pirellulales bacterium]
MLGEAKKRLETKYGRAPTEAELSQYMEISVEEVEDEAESAANLLLGVQEMVRDRQLQRCSRD